MCEVWRALCKAGRAQGTQWQVGKLLLVDLEAYANSGNSAEHAALADRVRMLEARLAAVTAGEQSEDSSCARPGPPALHLDTSFNDDLSYTGGGDQISTIDGFLSPNVPTIQITGPHGSNPSSPLALSPSPSLFSGTSRASSPDPFSSLPAFDFGNTMGASALTPADQRFIRTPPLNQWAEVYNQNLQTPISPGDHHVSRRSSVSSFGGLGEAVCAMDLDSSGWNMHTPFPDCTASNDFGDIDYMLPDPVVPSKPQAEALADKVFGSRFLPIERSAFRVCLEAVYLLPDHSADAHPAVQSMLSSYTTYSLRVARCLVFLVITVGLRMQAAAGESSAGLESTYGLAMQQLNSADFWSENGAQEITALLGALVEVSRI